MASIGKLNYTADEINEKLGKVDDVVATKVDKIIGVADYPRLYGVDESGSDDAFSVDHIGSYPTEEGNIPRRNANLCIYLPNAPQEATDSVNKAYVDGLIGDISTILTALHEGGIE